MAENGTQKTKKHTLATFAQAHGLDYKIEKKYPL